MYCKHLRSLNSVSIKLCGTIFVFQLLHLFINMLENGIFGVIYSRKLLKFIGSTAFNQVDGFEKTNLHKKLKMPTFVK